MKNILLELKKRIKLRTLILLIILLVFNSYAWFIYASKVSGSLTAHVSSWNVSFEAGEGETSTNMLFDVQRVYPGMETYTKTIVAHNRGETVATLSYNLVSLKVFGDTYAVGDNLTSEQLESMINNQFPFQINITSSSTSLNAQNGEATITISFSWAFESGNDTTDTLWGERAYTYYSTHPNESSVQLNIELTAQQQ